MHDLQGTHAPPKVFMFKVILNPPVSDVEVGSLKGGSGSGPEAVPPRDGMSGLMKTVGRARFTICLASLPWDALCLAGM